MRLFVISILLSSFVLNSSCAPAVRRLNNYYYFQIDFRIQLECTENPAVRRNTFVGFAVYGHGHERVFVHEMPDRGQRGVDVVLSTVHIRNVPEKSVHRQVQVLERRTARQPHGHVHVYFRIEDRLVDRRFVFDSCQYNINTRFGVFALNYVIVTHAQYYTITMLQNMISNYTYII